MRKRPVIWVTGPPGCGKTTLISSYLKSREAACLWYQIDPGDADPATFFYYLGLAAKRAVPQRRSPLPLLTREYLQGISTFSLRYFETLYGRLRIPCALVFDNYQEVPEGAPLHEIILNGLSHLPEGLNVILVSRRDPPPIFVRMGANALMDVLGWNDLRLTLEESAKIIRLRTKAKLARGSILRIHKTADGWVAGIILMLESAKGKGIGPKNLENLSREEIFGYFATEIFDKSDKDLQEFLLKTALLPKMSAKMAEKLTGFCSAGRILSQLCRTHYFTEKRFQMESIYQYHPLFREFLLSQGKEILPADAQSILGSQAAMLLEEAGQTEAAIPLLRDIGNWDEIVPLIMKHAPILLSQGRHKTLEEWLDFLPKAVLERHPWPLYWKGVCLSPFSPSLARPFFEKALEKFQNQKDASGFFLAWSELVLTIYYEFDDFSPLDRWVRLLEESMLEFREFPDKEIGARAASSMLMALINRQPWHPKIEEWADLTLSLSKSCSNIYEQMNAISQVVIYRIFIRDFKKGLAANDLLRQKQYSRNAPPLAILNAKLAEVIYYRYSGFHEKCMQSLSEGMDLSREKGIHVHENIFLSMGVLSALNVGDSKTVRELLAKLEPSLSDPKSWKALRYHISKAREALSRGDSGEASLNADSALKLVTDVGTPLTSFFCHLIKTHASHELGKRKEALNHLAQASHLASRIRSNLLKFLVLLTKALYAFEDQKQEAGLSSLRHALTIGREEGYFDTYIDQPKAVSKLCSKALEAGIEIEYVQELIRRLNITREKPALHLENWPWPLKIFTLGRFELLKDGKPIRFSRKPLTMLKALIALGGKEVKEDQITDILWPEADGDVAHQSFDTTLHRLRQLIGFHEAVQIREGLITLDSRCSWVDAWAFESLVDQADTAWKKRGEMTESIRQTQKAIALYQGAFLPGEASEPWTNSLRERLRSKFLRCVIKLGHYWQLNEDWEKAADCYQKGLEVDDIIEQFYQNLMMIYQQLDRRTEALSVYSRCKRTLSSALGIEPSLETEAIHKSLLAGKHS